MWIPKKSWKALEKRVADLEKVVQSQHTFDVDVVQTRFVRENGKVVKKSC